MPSTRVVFFRGHDGRAPVVDWLDELRRFRAPAFARCAARIQQLADAGHELRRPAADLLRDGIWELRARCGKEQYRILYFFHGRATVVLVHACRKERRVQEEDLSRAARRRAEFETNPAAHIYAEE